MPELASGRSRLGNCFQPRKSGSAEEDLHLWTLGPRPEPRELICGPSTGPTTNIYFVNIELPRSAVTTSGQALKATSFSYTVNPRDLDHQE